MPISDVNTEEPVVNTCFPLSLEQEDLSAGILRSAFKKKRILNLPIAPLLNGEVRFEWESLGKLL